MQIFYRWGEWIFTSDSIDIGWDGTSPEGEQFHLPYIFMLLKQKIFMVRNIDILVMLN